jgi:hypothetical protein
MLKFQLATLPYFPVTPRSPIHLQGIVSIGYIAILPCNTPEVEVCSSPELVSIGYIAILPCNPNQKIYPLDSKG